MSRSPILPSIELTAFSCPHCGALTTQHWHSAMVAYPEKDSLPYRYRNPDELKKRMPSGIDDYDQKKRFTDWIDRVCTGLPSIGDRYEKYVSHLDNADVSQCYNCNKVAIWIGDQMLWPAGNDAPTPNPDLPDDIMMDYVEAGQIIKSSPRGAAALLRLCVQKLCKHLGEPGKNINTDIASLVRKGLDARVQKMLDTLRVFGNSAVHPGELDIKDDRPTADRLFVLVNMIADIMISQPKAIAEMYGKIGTGQISAIEKRDGES
jgi:hypothetical protein